MDKQSKDQNTEIKRKFKEEEEDLSLRVYKKFRKRNSSEQGKEPLTLSSEEDEAVKEILTKQVQDTNTETLEKSDGCANFSKIKERISGVELNSNKKVNNKPSCSFIGNESGINRERENVFCKSKKKAVLGNRLNRIVSENCLDANEKQDIESIFDVDSSDSREELELKRNDQQSITLVSVEEVLKRIKKIIDFDDDSNDASALCVEKICTTKNISEIHEKSGVDSSDSREELELKRNDQQSITLVSIEEVLKRIKKIIDFDDDSNDASALCVEKICTTKNISEIHEKSGVDSSDSREVLKLKRNDQQSITPVSVEKVLKRIKKIIDFDDDSNDASALCVEKICTTKNISEIHEKSGVDSSDSRVLPELRKTDCQSINLASAESLMINKGNVLDIPKKSNNSQKIMELHIEQQEFQDKILDTELDSVVVNVVSDADSFSFLQSIADKNSSSLIDAYNKNSEKNLNMSSTKDLLNECTLQDTICNNENTEDEHKNIEQEKDISINNNDIHQSSDNERPYFSIIKISKEELDNIDIDVVGISSNSNSPSKSSTGQYQSEEENNSLSKNDFSNLEKSLKNNNLRQYKKTLSVALNNVLDIENDVGKLNVSQSTLNQSQAEKKTNSPISQSHCSNNYSSSTKHGNNNSSKKQPINILSKDQSKDNVLTHTVSKNENIDKNTYSARSIESPMSEEKCNTVELKIDIESKKTNLKIKNLAVKHSSIFPMITNSYGQKIFRFFWLDAYEDSYTDPGVVFLFGKVLGPTANQLQTSCCVTVKNIPRRIYILPRRNEAEEQSVLDNVYVELNEYMRKMNINKFKYRKVQKTYAFEKKDVPQNTTYLEVRYSAAYPALDGNYSGPAIQAIFGTNVTALELFLIEKNIKGPCWMDVKISPSANSDISSWCKFEINCASMQDISVTHYQQKDPGITPITVAALSIQVFLDEKLHKYELASVGILIQENFHLDKEPSKPLFNHSYCLVSQCDPWPKFAYRMFEKWKQPGVILCETETNLLEQLLELLQSFDPDILISYDTDFEFDILVRKILSLGIKDWSRVGKLRRTVPPKFKERIFFNQVLCGRPICDIQTSMNELQFRTMNSDLVSLYSSVLNKEVADYKEIKPDERVQYYSSIYNMTLLVKSTMTKASYILEISTELNILSLAMQITKIVGNTLSRTFSCGVGERNEFLLLHAFQSNNYLTPDKRKDKTDMYDGKKKSTYTGGVILDPKAGFYDTLILLLDFNSLYPSIIQEFNICFTTIPGAAHANVNDLSRVESHVAQGILPTVISRLVQSRLQIKKMINSPNLSPYLRRKYNSRQLALKLTANSMYGCLAASYSRFYAKGLAALVAMRGREIFQKTKDLIQSHNYEVIYGDTDSFMINVRLTDYEQVMAIGKELKRHVNKLFKNIKIDIDRVFKCLLLIKKKQYAGLTITRLPSGELKYNKEIKGLEIIRRDCCVFASDTGNQVLEELLKEQPSDVRLKNVFEILETTSRELREGKVPLSSLEIKKTLSKDPDKYTNKNYPHVIVAERLNKINARQLKAGAAISYIICEDNTTRKPLERAYHVEELKTNTQIKIDVTYYLLYQVFPIILKICDSIDGIEDVLIARSLGMADFYNPKQINKDQEGKVPLSLRDNRYQNCLPLKFNCRDCKNCNEIKTNVIHTKSGCRPSLESCSNPKCDTPPWKYPYLIQNKLQLAIRKCISKYYAGEIECSNPLCCNNKRSISMDSSNGLIKCYNCFDGKRYRKYTEIDLHNQLNFFLNIFTLDPAACQNSDLFISQELMDVYSNLREFMLDQIDSNAYSIVDLSKLFSLNVDSNKDDLENDFM